MPPAPAPAPRPAPVPLPVLPVDARLHTLNEATEIYMRENNIPHGTTLVAETRNPGKLGTKVKLEANAYGVEVHGSTTIYCYDVEIVAKVGRDGEKKLVFTKCGRDDYVVLDRHTKCVAIYKKALEDENDFFKLTKDNKLIYDGQKLLYSFQDLFPKGHPTRIMDLEIDTSSIAILGNLEKVTMTISASVKSVFEFSRENLIQMNINRDISSIDRSMVQFFELVLNQECVLDPSRFGIFEGGKVFILRPDKEKGYAREDFGPIGDGKEVLPGIKKSIAFIEGLEENSRNHCYPSVVIDSMKSVFHQKMTVYEKCVNIAKSKDQIDEHSTKLCSKILAGLDCYSTHTKRIRHLKIKSVSCDNAFQKCFQLPDGKRITVAEYFLERYNIKLQYPYFNLVNCKEGTKENLYPMELLTITSHQRVSVEQQSAIQGRSATKECTIVPNVRKRLIQAGVKAANLTPGSNPILQALNVQIFEPLPVDGRKLQGETLKFNRTTVNADGGKWKMPEEFAICGKVPKVWAMYAIVRNNRSRFDQHALQRFAQMFVRKANMCGLRLDAPNVYETASHDRILANLDYAAKCGCEYVFVISDDNITDLHATFKLKERQHGMIIQDCRLKTAENILNNRQLALNNIIAKLNIKLGGLNYEIVNSIFQPEHLIIGIGLSSMQAEVQKMSDDVKAMNPISVGYTSNAIHPHMFVGDFLLAQSGPGTFFVVEQIMKNCLNAYQKHRGTNPNRIIVYRSGASEGTFKAILTHEVALARHAIRSLGIVEQRLIYIVTSNDHVHRFFKTDNGGQSSGGYRSGGGYGNTSDQNIPPGIVIDKQATHPTFKMFFLNSHTTIQGSARTPSYTVLVDDLKAPMDKLEQMTYQLCHHHQIVGLTTSLPSPLFIANEYARRGKQLWNERVNKKTPMGGSQEQQLVQLNTELNYKDMKFSDQRINA